MAKNKSNTLALTLYAILCILLSSPVWAAKPIPLDLSIAPDVELQGYNGQRYKLSDFRGRMIALHFWASWCVPCRVEMPEMATFIKKYPKAVVIPISLDSNGRNAMRFLDEMQIAIPLIFGNAKVARVFQVRAVPTTIILDKDRRFLYKTFGAAPWLSKDFADLMLGFRTRLP